MITSDLKVWKDFTDAAFVLNFEGQKRATGRTEGK